MVTLPASPQPWRRRAPFAPTRGRPRRRARRAPRRRTRRRVAPRHEPSMGTRYQPTLTPRCARSSGWQARGWTILDGMAMGTVIDPVCGMTVSPDTAKGGSYLHDGVTYYFCSPGCRTKFAADPERWLRDGPTPHAPAAAPMTLHQSRPKAQGPGPKASSSNTHASSPKPHASSPTPVEYTCPMHPEIVQIGPGACPICGMDLEPRHVTLEEPESHELDDDDAPAVDCRRARGAAPRLHGGRSRRRPRRADVARDARPAVAGADARDAGLHVGRVAVLRARRAGPS